MSTVSSKSPARRVARRIASSPAVAGFRPATAALAVAAAFGLPSALVHAQPSGATAIHGQAVLTTSGSNLLVTTSNGAGTNHSAINWQSFSVPGGSTTHFLQPSATSASINRVVGSDPSAIFGTLSSNGRLVLVNPAGITVGAGAVVDTAGFTASALKMSEADAIAGRLLFSGSGAGLVVDGKILASGGDVFLIGSQVQVGSGAVVQANGATVLAAGEKVEITGRGLEGIRMEVQAGNEAVNLGSLKGDAVGIFAGTLRHSGLVSAQAVSSEGGKVVLKAAGDALVSGTVVANAGDKGGSIDVLGERVGLLAGATLQANGRLGGGSVRVGGDYQGANAQVPNAKRTYMDANARIEANAIEGGDGGRVIVWSDEFTRMDGRIEARGGADGGNGGFAEVSGKQYLDFHGLADLRAPKGAMGTLLLDPQDIIIVRSDSTSSGTMPQGDGVSTDAWFEPTATPGPALLSDSQLNNQLGYGNVLVTTTSSNAVINAGTGGQITVNADAVVSWTTASDLTLHADKGITVLGRVEGAHADAVLKLDARGGDIDVRSGATLVGGSITLLARDNVLIGTDQAVDTSLPPNPVYSTTTVDALKLLSITATNGSVVTGNPSGYNTVNLYGGGGATGGIDVKAAVNAQFDWYTTLESDYSPIKVTATSGSILGNGTFVTKGSVDAAGATGKVTLEATNGSIDFYQITTAGTDLTAGRHGGDVKLAAKNGITGYSIDTNGDYTSERGNGGDVDVQGGGVVDISWIDAHGGASLTAGANAGSGGTVYLSGGMGVDVGSIETWGGSYSATSGAAGGGAAGQVDVIAASGNVEVGIIDSWGGDGHSSRAGGVVNITASKGAVDIGEVYAYGGDSFGTLAGGEGGKVTIRSAGDTVLRPGSYSPFAIWADGGASDFGIGGNGGRIEIVTGGNLQVIPDTRTESLVQTAAFSSSFTSGMLSASGGGGGSASSGLTGGDGGVIHLERTGGGALVVDESMTLVAVGGQGGMASASTGSGGTGGAGGTIELASTMGTVYVRSPKIYANGGSGGMNANESPGGTQGAMGNMTASGTSVEVEGNFELNAKWTNKSVVNLRGASIVYGVGSFRNESDLALHDTSALIPTSVENAGRLTSFGSDTEATLVSNTGLVDVVAGSTFRAPTFYANSGTVQVNGTLDIGGSTHSVPAPPPPPVEECSLCVLQVAPTAFVNEASGTLTGNGNIIVNGGAGTIDNFGTLAPGGAGTVGTLTLTGNLIMESGSTVATDLLSTSSFDQLAVSGTARTGGSYTVNYLPGTSFSAGDSFAVLQASALDASTLPTVNAGELSVGNSGNSLVLRANAPFPPAPAPAPAPVPDATAPAVQVVTNQVVTFMNLFLQEAEQQQQQEAKENEIGRDDIVVTDTACTPR